MSITYYFGKKPYGKDVEHSPMACFSNCYNKGHINGKYITYVPQEVRPTKEQIYKYLLFLRKIPEFKPWIRKPKELAEKQEMTFDCSENNRGIFLAFTLFRAIEEFPSFVIEISKINTRKKYDLSYLGILRLFSHSNWIHNTNHWVIGSLTSFGKEELEKPIRVDVLNEGRPLKEGLERKLFEVMNYGNEDYFGSYGKRNSHVDACNKWIENNMK
jgi:hypothetical protein